MANEFVQVRENGHVAILTIDRPKALNALNDRVLSELASEFTRIASGECRVVILTGAGEKAFVAGADIVQLSEMSPEEALAYAERGHALMDQIEALPQPVIAAVNGYALGGGCELALACDLIYASENARFGQPEVNLGLMPGFGGTVRLPRKVGAAVASEWIFSGNTFSASEAAQVGLIREVLAPDALIPRCLEVAAVIAKRAPKAVAASKQVVVGSVGMVTSDAAALEREVFSKLFESSDVREGTRAFLEKREPSFKGA